MGAQGWQDDSIPQHFLAIPSILSSLVAQHIFAFSPENMQTSKKNKKMIKEKQMKTNKT